MDTQLNEREHLLMECSQLLWEVVQDICYPPVKPDSDVPAIWFNAREVGGVGQLRLDCREAAPYLQAAFDRFEEVAGDPPGEFSIAYDFEFTPWFVETCLHPDFAGVGAAFGVNPDWRERVTEYAREAKAKADQELFKRFARTAFTYLWGCTPETVECDLSSLYDPDADNLARSALDAVEDWGRDLDLSSTDPMMREDAKRRDLWVRDLLDRAAQ